MAHVHCVCVCEFYLSHVVCSSDRRGFLSQLMSALQGNPVMSTGGKDSKHVIAVNLKELYREITVRGGLEEVST